MGGYEKFERSSREEKRECCFQHRYFLGQRNKEFRDVNMGIVVVNLFETEFEKSLRESADVVNKLRFSKQYGYCISCGGLYVEEKFIGLLSLPVFRDLDFFNFDSGRCARCVW